ncbi:hypothetical protein QOZ80_4AG0303620 [Eleusine coracana subsp. coracana]|nr:hypothetical protein QOZ80_4AG0303620 [Eleusine coracana subsp. coracana]
MASGRLLVALCMVALFAVRSEGHGLEEFTGGNTQATPAMESFFGAKPEAAELPEALDASMPAKPEAASAIPTTTAAAATTTDTTTTTSLAAPAPRRSVSVAAGVACGVAAVAVVGVAAAVAYVVRARRAGARRESGAVQLGSSA